MKSTWRKHIPKWVKGIYHAYKLRELYARRNFTEEQWKEEIRRQYFAKLGVYPDLENPQTYNEKIQWRKLYDRDPAYTILADKYAVREWVKQKIGEEHLVPLSGVWDSAEDIDFSKLPNSFVLKTNNASGTNIVVEDKSKINESKVRRKMAYCLKVPFWAAYGEFHYRDIAPKIIAEKFLKPRYGESDVRDYKFDCFRGKAHFFSVITNRRTTHQVRKYNIDGTPTYKFSEQDIAADLKLYRENPTLFAEMTRIAEILAAGFEHVRVDLYESEGKIYFGEMTFASAAGYITDPELQECLKEMGDAWDIHVPQVDHTLVGI